MKRQNIMDTFTIMVGVPSFGLIISGIAGMIIFARSLWPVLSVLQRVTAGIGFILFSSAALGWVILRMRKSFYVIPKLLLGMNTRAETIVSAQIRLHKIKHEDWGWDAESVALLGADVEGVIKSLSEDQNESKEIIKNQVKDIGDKIGEPHTKTKLGWFMDNTVGGYHNLTRADSGYLKLENRLQVFRDNPPSPEIAGDITQTLEYLYQYYSSLIYIEKVNYNKKVEVLGEPPQTKAIRYGLPEKHKERFSVLMGKLNKDIYSYYKG